MDVPTKVLIDARNVQRSLWPNLSDSELVEFAASPATEPLYPVDPFENEGIARMFKTHPPLELRVRRLRELGAGRNGRGDTSLTELAG